MKNILLILILFIAAETSAQRTAFGKVTDASNNQPVIASVFLSNTSIGTTTSSDGKFSLSVPEGRYEMIISSIGYETYVVSVNATSSLDNLTIKLKSKIKELESVTLEPYEKDGWQKWGKFFLENFIGMSALAKDCKIENYEAIKFRNSRKDGRLSAYAFEPLMITNDALGYRIQYQMEEFSYGFRERIIYYSGYPLFIPMKGSKRKLRRWEQAREEVYYGSQMHFMRSLYRNILNEEGFEMHKLVKQINEEKLRVKSIVRAVAQVGSDIVIANSNGDSSHYYNKVLKQPDSYDFLDKNLLPADSVAYAVNATTAGLDFNDYLWIRYSKKKAPMEYQNFSPEKTREMSSTIHLVNGQPIEIQSNGYFFDGRQVLSSGYWGWSEKIAMMLPYNYKPKEKAP